MAKSFFRETISDPLIEEEKAKVIDLTEGHDFNATTKLDALNPIEQNSTEVSDADIDALTNPNVEYYWKWVIICGTLYSSKTNTTTVTLSEEEMVFNGIKAEAVILKYKDIAKLEIVPSPFIFQLTLHDRSAFYGVDLSIHDIYDLACCLVDPDQLTFKDIFVGKIDMKEVELKKIHNYHLLPSSFTSNYKNNDSSAAAAAAAGGICKQKVENERECETAEESLAEESIDINSPACSSESEAICTMGSSGRYGPEAYVHESVAKEDIEENSLSFLQNLVAPAPTLHFPHERLKPIVVFPRNAKDAISLNWEDKERLKPNQYLNDSIIDFYLRYIKENEHLHKFYFFNTFFYKSLEKESIRKWTKKENIFDYKFLVVPINEEFHWKLAIFHNGDLATSLNTDTTDCVKALKKAPTADKGHPFNNEASKNSACILLFDSLGAINYDSKAVVFNNLRKYLTDEWKVKKKGVRVFTASNCPGYVPMVPLQMNHIDCGVYLLQYVRNFVDHTPIDFSNEHVLNEQIGSSWFDHVTIKRLRKRIYKTISTIQRKTEPALLQSDEESADEIFGASGEEEGEEVKEKDKDKGKTKENAKEYSELNAAPPAAEGDNKTNKDISLLRPLKRELNLVPASLSSSSPRKKRKVSASSSSDESSCSISLDLLTGRPLYSDEDFFSEDAKEEKKKHKKNPKKKKNHNKKKRK